MIENISRVVVGKADAVRQAVSALLAGGHILIEDVPGVGKTVLARAIARSVGGTFKRVQFTADLLPSDITGVTTYQQDTGQFVFRPGPVFTNVLLGDEINRATPRTQSSLLEAMEEMHVTIDGSEHPVQRPFLVVATQNPIELEGTYPLPFAQMDRFIVRITLGYLDEDQETRMLSERVRDNPIEHTEPVLSCADLLALQEAVVRVRVSEEVLRYVVRIVQATRSAEGVDYGASPRAGLDLMHYAQAGALIEGRDYVLPDDVKAAVPAVLGHRLITRTGTRRVTANAGDLLAELLRSVEVPL